MTSLRQFVVTVFVSGATVFASIRWFETDTEDAWLYGFVAFMFMLVIMTIFENRRAFKRQQGTSIRDIDEQP